MSVDAGERPQRRGWREGNRLAGVSVLHQVRLERESVSSIAYDSTEDTYNSECDNNHGAQE
jgi:hypothetical protein